MQCLFEFCLSVFTLSGMRTVSILRLFAGVVSFYSFISKDPNCKYHWLWRSFWTWWFWWPENFLIPLISISFEGFKTSKRKKQRIASLHKTVISEMSRKLDKEYFEEQNLVLKLFIHDYAKINWQDQTQTTSKFFGYSSLFKTNQNKVCAILPVLLWKGILGIDES